MAVLEPANRTMAALEDFPDEVVFRIFDHGVRHINGLRCHVPRLDMVLLSRRTYKICHPLVHRLVRPRDAEDAQSFCFYLARRRDKAVHVRRFELKTLTEGEGADTGQKVHIRAACALAVATLAMASMSKVEHVILDLAQMHVQDIFVARIREAIAAMRHLRTLEVGSPVELDNTELAPLFDIPQRQPVTVSWQGRHSVVASWPLRPASPPLADPLRALNINGVGLSVEQLKKYLDASPSLADLSLTETCASVAPEHLVDALDGIGGRLQRFSMTEHSKAYLGRDLPDELTSRLGTIRYIDLAGPKLSAVAMQSLPSTLEQLKLDGKAVIGRAQVEVAMA